MFGSRPPRRVGCGEKGVEGGGGGGDDGEEAHGLRSNDYSLSKKKQDTRQSRMMIVF